MDGERTGSGLTHAGEAEGLGMRFKSVLLIFGVG